MKSQKLKVSIFWSWLESIQNKLKGQPEELNKCDNANTDAETKETSKAARDAATPEVPKVQEVHKEKSNLPSSVSKFCWTFSI